ncbi:MAG: RNA-binding protein, partial [Myxococcales bacterium]|nr:RNA-binding protein [Myxococcales bacterium]
MSKRLFVGNLSFQTSEEDLRIAFAAHGEVVDAKIITDRETGRSRGF